MRVRIFGKHYRLVFTRELPENRRGDCDPPHVKGKKIRIRKGLNEEETLEVLVHEALHAADWHRDEEWVTIVAQDISKILWKLGYRRAGVEDDAA